MAQSCSRPHLISPYGPVGRECVDITLLEGMSLHRRAILHLILYFFVQIESTCRRSCPSSDGMLIKSESPFFFVYFIRWSEMFSSCVREQTHCFPTYQFNLTWTVVYCSLSNLLDTRTVGCLPSSSSLSSSSSCTWCWFAYRTTANVWLLNDDLLP